MITPDDARALSASLTKQGMPVVAQSVRDLAQQVEDLQKDAARYRGLRARGIRRMVFEDEEDADKQADEAIK